MVARATCMALALTLSATAGFAQEQKVLGIFTIKQADVDGYIKFQAANAPAQEHKAIGAGQRASKALDQVRTLHEKYGATDGPSIADGSMLSGITQPLKAAFGFIDSTNETKLGILNGTMTPDQAAERETTNIKATNQAIETWKQDDHVYGDDISSNTVGEGYKSAESYIEKQFRESGFEKTGKSVTGDGSNINQMNLVPEEGEISEEVPSRERDVGLTVPAPSGAGPPQAGSQPQAQQGMNPFAQAIIGGVVSGVAQGIMNGASSGGGGGSGAGYNCPDKNGHIVHRKSYSMAMGCYDAEFDQPGKDPGQRLRRAMKNNGF